MKDEAATDSGIPVKKVYEKKDVSSQLSRSLGAPGSFPYARGIYPGMYRDKLWTMRQYTGFGSARETNSRFKYLIARGETGLSTAFDLPTQLGLDSDHERSNGEVGRVGVALLMHWSMCVPRWGVVSGLMILHRSCRSSMRAGMISSKRSRSSGLREGFGRV